MFEVRERERGRKGSRWRGTKKEESKEEKERKRRTRMERERKLEERSTRKVVLFSFISSELNLTAQEKYQTVGKMSKIEGLKLRINANDIDLFISYDGKSFRGFLTPLANIVYGWMEHPGVNRTIISSKVKICIHSIFYSIFYSVEFSELDSKSKSLTFSTLNLIGRIWKIWSNH